MMEMYGDCIVTKALYGKGKYKIIKRKEKPMKNLGSYIKSRRENIGMSQRELAKLTGITPVTICRYESGSREPKVSDFEKICKVLGMKMDDYVGKE